MALKLPRLTLSSQALLALVLGVATGIFFGEIVAPLRVVGRGFIMLLQMTVIPYVTVALIQGLGSLSYQKAKSLAITGGILLLIFWGIGLGLLALVPLAFPSWPSASFFSASLIEEPKPLDFLSLYIPANPFHALANATIPAIVLFSIATGLALIGVRQKESVLGPLSAFAEALARVTQFVALLTPLGIFALSASAAGTMEIDELGRLQVYITIYVVVTVALVFGIVPALVAALTPFGYRDVVRAAWPPLVTAFATGSLLVVLPLLTERVKAMLEKVVWTSREARESSVAEAAVLIPTAFSFPHLGSLLTLSFIAFCGWYVSLPLSPADYPNLAITGLASMFGGSVVAIPFLLDLFQLPADLFQLFLTIEVIGGRLHVLLGTIQLFTIGLIGAYAMQGLVRLRWKSLLRFAALSTVSVAIALGGVSALYTHLIIAPYTKDEQLKALHLPRHTQPAEVLRAPSEASGNPARPRSFEQIERSGVLRICYQKDDYPNSFFNAQGDLVGFDIDLAHQLARDLDLNLEFLPLASYAQAERVNQGYCDIAMVGVAILPYNARRMSLTRSFKSTTLGLVVRDHRGDDFKTWEAIRRLGPIRVAYVTSPYADKIVRRLLPEAEVLTLDSVAEERELFESGGKESDAIATTAEEGAAWTILYPRFNLVVPRPVISLPTGYAVARGNQGLLDVLDSWLLTMEANGAIETTYNYWIKGQTRAARPPRWSVIRNLLGWVE